MNSFCYISLSIIVLILFIQVIKESKSTYKNKKYLSEWKIFKKQLEDIKNKTFKKNEYLFELYSEQYFDYLEELQKLCNKVTEHDFLLYSEEYDDYEKKLHKLKNNAILNHNVKYKPSTLEAWFTDEEIRFLKGESTFKSNYP